MSLKLQKVISLFSEKKYFFNNHLDVYQFIKKNFGNKLPVGTKVTISIQLPFEESKSVEFRTDGIDKKFLDNLSEIIND